MGRRVSPQIRLAPCGPNRSCRSMGTSTATGPIAKQRRSVPTSSASAGAIGSVVWCLTFAENTEFEKSVASMLSPCHCATAKDVLPVV